MIARLFIVALLAFGLAGCVDLGTALRLLKNKAAGAADTHYTVTKEAYCDTQSSGALKRKVYGTAEWKRFKDTCWHGKKAFPETPDPPKAPDG